VVPRLLAKLLTCTIQPSLNDVHQPGDLHQSLLLQMFHSNVEYNVRVTLDARGQQRVVLGIALNGVDPNALIEKKA
jgi:hypothetical protein